MEAERPSMSGPSNAGNIYEPMAGLTSSLRRRPSSPGLSNLNNTTLTEEKKPNDKEVQRQKLAKKLNGWKEVLLDEISHSGVASNLLEILKTLVPIVQVQGKTFKNRNFCSRISNLFSTIFCRRQKFKRRQISKFEKRFNFTSPRFQNLRIF